MSLIEKQNHLDKWALSMWHKNNPHAIQTHLLNPCTKQNSHWVDLGTVRGVGVSGWGERFACVSFQQALCGDTAATSK